MNQQGIQSPEIHKRSALFPRQSLVRPTSASSDNRVGHQNHKVIHRESRRNGDRNRKLKEFPGDQHHLGDHPSKAQPEEVIPNLLVHLIVVSVPHFAHLPFRM